MMIILRCEEAKEGEGEDTYFDMRERRRRDLRKKTEVITPTIRTWVPEEGIRRAHQKE